MRTKKGFTLAEVVIAVGIIGVIAALMASAFNHVKPDKTKFMYLKAYDALCEVVAQMGRTPSLFAQTSSKPFGDDSANINVDITNVPFMDLNKPTTNLFNSVVNDGDFLKFATLFAYALKAKKEDITRTTDNSSLSFTSGPGNYIWTITPKNYVFTNKKAGFANEVKLKIGNEDEFTFCVQADGEVQVVNDSDSSNRGWTYINNRKKTKSENDIAKITDINSCTSTYYTVNSESDHYIVSDTVYTE